MKVRHENKISEDLYLVANFFRDAIELVLKSSLEAGVNNLKNADESLANLFKH